MCSEYSPWPPKRCAYLRVSSPYPASLLWKNADCPAQKPTEDPSARVATISGQSMGVTYPKDIGYPEASFSPHTSETRIQSPRLRSVCFCWMQCRPYLFGSRCEVERGGHRV